MTDKAAGCDDGVACDIPEWSLAILKRETCSDDIGYASPHTSAASTLPLPTDEMSVLNGGGREKSQSVPLSSRLAAEKPKKTFRWGACPIHQCARSPHVFSGSSQKAARAAYVCNLFFKRGDDNRLLCWHFQYANANDIKEWPLVQKDKFCSLENRFGRARK